MRNILVPFLSQLQGKTRLHQVQVYSYVTPIHILNNNQNETLLQLPTDHNK